MVRLLTPLVSTVPALAITFILMSVAAHAAADRIEVSPAQLTFTALGESQTVSVRVYDENNLEIEDEPVIYVVSFNEGPFNGEIPGHNDFLQVSGGLEITAGVTGTGDITISIGSGESVNVPISVRQVPTTLTVTPNVLTLDVGQTVTLQAAMSDANGYEIQVDDGVRGGLVVNWESSDSAIVTIEGVAGVYNGKESGATADVTAVGDGTVKITANWQAVTTSVTRTTNPPGSLRSTAKNATLSEQVHVTVGAASANTAPTGLPTISGTARVGETLTASASGISDADGLASATFSWQWVANDGTSDADIPGAAGSTYTLTSGEVGKTIKVRATFTDNRGTEETVLSDATAAVATAYTCTTPNLAGRTEVWTGTLTVAPAEKRGTVFGYGFNRGPDGGGIYGELSDTSFDFGGTSYVITAVVLAIAPSRIPGLVVMLDKSLPDTEQDMLRLHVCGNAFDLASVDVNSNHSNKDKRYWWANPGIEWSSATTVSLALSGTINQVATGAPAITGTPQVGQTLTAGPGDIADGNGIANATFAWQWIASDGTSDADIADATGAEYTLTSAEAGKTIKVRVTFTDDEGTEEILESAATVTVASPGAQALTAQFENAPGTHDGASAFNVFLRFSETPANVKNFHIKGALAITGGKILRVRVVGGVNGDEAHRRIEIEPDGDGDVRLSLFPTTDCAATNALCTADGGKLESLISLSIPGPAPASPSLSPPSPLTASFEQVPDEHDGASALNVYLRFSEAPANVKNIHIKGSLAITGGKILRVRVVGGVNGDEAHRRVEIEPAGDGDVQLSLVPTTDCAAANALCTAAGGKLETGVGVTIPGPVAIGVADATVEEAAGAVLAFAVSLDRARHDTVTVDYATEDGTATAGEDYTAMSGTLTFAVGETGKTVDVPILDDAHDEGNETMVLKLSNATGARIADAEATGTIENTDSMPKAWLARFGRTASVHVLDAVEERLRGGAPSKSWAQLGGYRIGPGPDVSESVSRLAPDRRLWDEVPDADSRGDYLTLDQVLLGSAFHMVSNLEDTSSRLRLSAWGRVATSGFDGREDQVSFDGRVTTATLGVDGTYERWLTGLAVAYSQGEGGYSMGDTDAAELESTLTSLHPYAAWRVSDRVTLWGLVGYGSGSLELVRQEAMSTDLTLRMGAVGVRGEVLSQSRGLTLAIRSDALWTQTSSGATAGLAATESEASRLRLVLEGSRRVEFRDGGSLTPVLEVGLRRDGGDAEEGSGVEVGGRLGYRSAFGLSLEISLRALVAHESEDYEEWGASGSLRFDPGQQGLGLTASVSPQWGLSSGGVGELWSRPDTRGLAGGNGLPQPLGRVHAELGYGVAMLNSRGILTPYARVALSEGADQAWHLGTRLTLRESLDVSLEATRRHREGERAAHDLALLATLPW